jgi:hypothetical protein
MNTMDQLPSWALSRLRDLSHIGLGQLLVIFLSSAQAGPHFLHTFSKGETMKSAIALVSFSMLAALLQKAAAWLKHFGVAVASLVVAVGAVAMARADNQRPTQANIDDAKGIAQLLQNEMVAALLQEFNETTAANAEQGKVAIGLIFNDANPAIRLIGTLSPLDRGNVPRDNFEKKALFNAVSLNGTPFEAVEQSQDGNNGWFYRRSIPLSNFHPACVICHTNFGPENPNKWVGALTLRVPIPN